MIVQARTTLTRDGVVFQPGDRLEVDDDTADRLVAEGLVSRVVGLAPDSARMGASASKP